MSTRTQLLKSQVELETQTQTQNFTITLYLTSVCIIHSNVHGLGNIR